MEAWIESGIALVTLGAFFGVPAALATGLALIAAREKRSLAPRRRWSARLVSASTALAMAALATSTALAAEAASGPAREEYSLWPAHAVRGSTAARVETPASGPAREEYSLWPVASRSSEIVRSLAHLEIPASGPARAEFSLWPAAHAGRRDAALALR